MFPLNALEALFDGNSRAGHKDCKEGFINWISMSTPILRSNCRRFIIRSEEYQDGIEAPDYVIFTIISW